MGRSERRAKDRIGLILPSNCLVDASATRKAKDLIKGFPGTASATLIARGRRIKITRNSRLARYSFLFSFGVCDFSFALRKWLGLQLTFFLRGAYG